MGKAWLPCHPSRVHLPSGLTRKLKKVIRIWISSKISLLYWLLFACGLLQTKNPKTKRGPKQVTKAENTFSSSVNTAAKKLNFNGRWVSTDMSRWFKLTKQTFSYVTRLAVKIPEIKDRELLIVFHIGAKFFRAIASHVIGLAWSKCYDHIMRPSMSV